MKTFGESPDAYFDSPVASYPAPVKALLTVATRVVWLWSKIYWPWKIEGANPFEEPAADGRGRVFVANHASMLDPALLMAVAYTSGSTLRPLYKGEFEKSAFVTWFFSRVSAIPIKRGTADTKALKRAVKALQRGENILVFPEGTRVWDPDARPELFGGFAMIAQMAGCDVVPVAIDGTERINPEKRHVLCRPSRVRLRVGEPIAVADVPGDNRRAKAEALESLAMDRVYAMRAELRAGRALKG